MGICSRRTRLMKKVGTPKKPVVIGLNDPVPTVPTFFNKSKRVKGGVGGEEGIGSGSKSFFIFWLEVGTAAANPITTGKNGVPTYRELAGTEGTNAA